MTFHSPLAKWAEQPSFLVGEWLFIALAALCFAHAFRQGPGEERRRHLLCWVGALVAGTANDAIFMALPLVDNFWQAQATIMLTPRMPLYIPCVYICFMYFPTVASWRTGLHPLPRAALAGLLGILFYAPYDIVGAKFLWWTWHDTDAPIANRLLGAPIGSTIWVITFVAAFSWLVSRRASAWTLLLVALGSTPLMVLQMTALQQLDGGVPGVRGLLVVAAVYAALAAFGRRGTPAPGRDRLLAGGAVVYYATLALILLCFDPATHRSASRHQTYGPCHVEAKDLMGHVRYRYVCAADFDEDYGFDCLDRLPADGSDWYTVCGRPHRSFALWMAVVGGLGLTGSAAYGWLLRRRG